jgi:hypothetical protein
MRTLVVYESMFGNTHAIAAAIGDGLRGAGDVQVVPVSGATSELLDCADFVIAGGPTHVHGMTTASTRKRAFEQAAEPDSDLTLDPSAAGRGIREWLGMIGDRLGKRAAAFDTRAMGPALFTGRASRGIANRLRDHGYTLVAEPESFLIDARYRLLDGELDRARAWGASLPVESAV